MADKQEMTFWDHIEDLRWTLFRSVIALMLFAIIGFLFMEWIFDHIILAPCYANFFLYDWMCTITQSVSFFPDFCNQEQDIPLQNINLGSQFFRYISTSFGVAFILTFPYLTFEIWKFVRPALYKEERNSFRWVFLFGTLMFFIGCFVAYAIIFPLTLRFLYNFQLSSNIVNHLTLDSYMDNFISIVFVMGIVFELPLVSWLLSKLGILKRSFFKKYRRHAIVVLLILAAVITPTGDPFTLTIVFIPLYILYELSTFLVKK
jgi:Twin arginine targeting (Tat) protein translocase TatC